MLVGHLAIATTISLAITIIQLIAASMYNFFLSSPYLYSHSCTYVYPRALSIAAIAANRQNHQCIHFLEPASKQDLSELSTRI